MWLGSGMDGWCAAGCVRACSGCASTALLAKRPPRLLHATHPTASTSRTPQP